MAEITRLAQRTKRRKHIPNHGDSWHSPDGLMMRSDPGFSAVWASDLGWPRAKMAGQPWRDHHGGTDSTAFYGMV